MLYSFIIPTFREEGLDEALQQLQAILAKYSISAYEILIVDDSDSQFFSELKLTINSRGDDRILLIRGIQQGKGAAIRIGFTHSRGSVVFFLDADLPVDLNVIPKFAASIHGSRCDLAIAQAEFVTSNLPLFYVPSYHTDFLRFQSVLVFQRLIFRDTQCGFKAIRGDIARALGQKLKVNGGMFDIELLYSIIQNGLRVGTFWVHAQPEIRPSKIRVFRCIVNDPLELLAVRLRGLMKFYKLETMQLNYLFTDKDYFNKSRTKHYVFERPTK